MCSERSSITEKDPAITCIYSGSKIKSGYILFPKLSCIFVFFLFLSFYSLSSFFLSSLSDSVFLSSSQNVMNTCCGWPLLLNWIWQQNIAMFFSHLLYPTSQKLFHVLQLCSIKPNYIVFTCGPQWKPYFSYSFMKKKCKKPIRCNQEECKKEVLSPFTNQFNFWFRTIYSTHNKLEILSFTSVLLLSCLNFNEIHKSSFVITNN